MHLYSLLSTVFSVVTVLCPWGTLVTIDEPILIRCNLLKGLVVIGFALGVVCSVCFDDRAMPRTYRCSITRRCVPAPKTLCSAFSSLPPSLPALAAADRLLSPQDAAVCSPSLCISVSSPRSHSERTCCHTSEGLGPCKVLVPSFLHTDSDLRGH